MNTEAKFNYFSKNLQQSLALGEKLAKFIQPPFLIELVGDLGGGKTVLVKGLAEGLKITKAVTSPTFNIHRSYNSPSGLVLEHFDLYRLENDEIVLQELKESFINPKAIVCVEWAAHFKVHLNDDRLIITCHFIDETTREYSFKATGLNSQKLLRRLKDDISIKD